MTYKIYPEQDVEAIAEAIRNKNGLTNKYKIGEMAEAINNLGIYSLSGEDNAPYLYRKTPLTSDAELDKIVGGSVVFNQLFNITATTSETVNDVTFSKSDGALNISGTASATIYKRLQVGIPTVNNHKILVKCNDTALTGVIVYDDNGANAQFTDVSTNKVFSANGADIRYYLRIINGTSINSAVYPQLFDLTQMFGTTIADYVYQLEQATAGSGVAWLKSLGFFTDDYYPYNAGEIKSVSGLSSHDMVGFNQWDEEWELGGLAWASGEPVTLNDRIRSKNYSPCEPNTQYNIYNGQSGVSSVVAFFYDIDKTFISWTGNQLFTTPDNTYFFKIVAQNRTTYNNDICINISDTNRNGEYEPYIKHSYPLDNTITLRGIPKITDGKIYYDGDEYNSDGGVDRLYNIVEAGTLNWTYSSSDQWFQAYHAHKSSGLCSKYETIADLGSGFVDKMCAIVGNYFVIKDTSFGTDANALKTSLQNDNVTILYKLSEPTTETAEPYSTIQNCDGAGTEEYVTTGIPVGHETKYLEVVEI